MKVYFYIAIITLFLTNCIPSAEIEQEHYNEYVINGNVKYHFPIRLDNFEYVCVDTNFQIVGQTRSIPPHIFKKIKDFNFEILLKIRVHSKDVNWNRPIYVEIDRLSSDTDTLKLTRNEEILYSGMFYNIPFKISAMEGERIFFRLGFKNKAGDVAIFAKPGDPYRSFDLIF